MARRAKKEMKAEKGSRNVYNAAGSPEMESADDETPGMKKGGKAKKHMKRKHGGKVEGHEPKHRADKKARGGHVKKHPERAKEHERMGEHFMMERHKRASGGRTPYTSGHMTHEPEESGKTDSGHESQRP